MACVGSADWIAVHDQSGFVRRAFRFGQHAFINCAAAFRAAADQPRRPRRLPAPFELLEDSDAAREAVAADCWDVHGA
jgi:hypothetical protein